MTTKYIDTVLYNQNQVVKTTTWLMSTSGLIDTVFLLILFNKHNKAQQGFFFLWTTDNVHLQIVW